MLHRDILADYLVFNAIQLPSEYVTFFWSLRVSTVVVRKSCHKLLLFYCSCCQYSAILMWSYDGKSFSSPSANTLFSKRNERNWLWHLFWNVFACWLYFSNSGRLLLCYVLIRHCVAFVLLIKSRLCCPSWERCCPSPMWEEGFSWYLICVHLK